MDYTILNAKSERHYGFTIQNLYHRLYNLNTFFILHSRLYNLKYKIYVTNYTIQNG